MKSIPWPLCGHKDGRLIPGACAGTWGRIQEESSKGYQGNPFIRHEGDGMCFQSCSYLALQYIHPLTDALAQC